VTERGGSSKAIWTRRLLGYLLRRR